MISSSRDENFYKTFKFYYTSSLNPEGTNWSSFEYLPAGQMNQGNYTTSVRNARFDGCKLPDNDVTNKISFPMYTPNYTYLDANEDPSRVFHNVTSVASTTGKANPNVNFNAGGVDPPYEV